MIIFHIFFFLWILLKYTTKQVGELIFFSYCVQAGKPCYCSSEAPESLTVTESISLYCIFIQFCFYFFLVFSFLKKNECNGVFRVFLVTKSYLC